MLFVAVLNLGSKVRAMQCVYCLQRVCRGAGQGTSSNQETVTRSSPMSEKCLSREVRSGGFLKKLVIELKTVSTGCAPSLAPYWPN